MLGLGGHDNDFGFHEEAIRIFKQRSDGVCHMFLEHHLECWVENRVPIGSKGGSREKGAIIQEGSLVAQTKWWWK